MAASSTPPTDLPTASRASRFGWLNTRLKQAIAAVIGLATLIGAVQVIVGVIPSGPETQTAKVGTLNLGAATLEEFQASQEFQESASVRMRLASQPVQLETPTETPTPTPEETQTPTPTPTPVCDPTVEECPPGEEEPDVPDERQLEEEYDMGPGCESDPASGTCALADLAESAGQSDGGDPEPSATPRRQTIARVRRILEGTRTRRDDDGRLQPLGMMVSFDVTFTGLEDEDVVVFWSMLSADTRRPLTSDWLRNTRAAVLRPRHETDQIGKDIWLPLPRRRGDYVARVTFRDPDDETLTSVRTDVFH
jgi:hypothetical protein